MTFRADRVVLGVARTVTSAVRLLEALEVLRSDSRIQVVFAIDGGSPFIDGAAELLLHAGVRLLPWEQLSELTFDLVVTATENVDLRGFAAPVVVLPHGIGFNKFVPAQEGGVRLSGLIRQPVPTGQHVTLVVSHPDQAAQVAADAPGWAPSVRVVGDPTFERLRASVRMRPRYRSALRLRSDQHLAVVTSTWGGQSLWGVHPDLPERLLAALPFDEYRVAMVLHPNIWFGHSRWQVRAWLGDALDAGLMLVPPEVGWQAAVCAADIVIGDHGSVTLYAAANGTPTLLATFGNEVVPGTAMAWLGTAAPRLDLGGDLRMQLARAVSAPQLDGVASRVFAEPAGAVERLLALLYERLGLAPRAAAQVRMWPEPMPEGEPVRSFVVYTDCSSPDRIVAARRYPAEVAGHPEAESEILLRHLVAFDDVPHERTLTAASLVVTDQVMEAGNAAAWASAALERYPGAYIVAVRLAHSTLVRLRRGGALVVEHAGDLDHAALWSAVAVASWRRLGRSLSGPVTMVVADQRIALHFVDAVVT